MRSIALLLCTGIGMWAAPLPTVVPLQKSTSSSGQFVIYHGDGTLRGRLTRRVEDVKMEWLKVIGVTDDWTHPIIIQIPTIRPRTPQKLTTSVFEADGGALKIQIDVYDLTALTTPEFDREIFRALSLEFAYRDISLKAGKSVQQPPAWLLDAFAEEASAKKEGLNTDVYQHLTQTGAPPKFEAFIKLNPERMDPTSRAIYRAQSLALLRALLEQPQGGKNLGTYLAALPGSSATNARTFYESFPQLEGDSGLLAKIWTLSLARLSASNRIQPLSVEETEKRLAQILDITAPADPKKPDEIKQSGAAAFPQIARSETGRFILRQKQEQLMNLEIRSHPFYRPVVEEYRIIVSELALKPKKNVDKRIAKNGELRTLVLKRCTEINDYVNWFEATQVDTASNKFENSLNLGKGDPLETERSDSITRYLDKIDRQGW